MANNASFYTDNDAGHNICKLVTGGACESIFGRSQRFYALRTIDGLREGESIVIALGDNFNITSDNRTLALVWDDNIVMTTAQQEEGSVAQYPIRKVQGSRLTVWCDESIVATVTPMTQSDANKVIDDDNKSFGDSLTDVALALREQQDKILLGAAIVAIVLIIGAAYAIANTKINPGIKVGL